jgi:transcriptional regulator of acetoin/glycerol metabolism
MINATAALTDAGVIDPPDFGVGAAPVLTVPCLTLEELAGEDPQMRRNVQRAYRIVDTDIPVLIQGPTGSGKEAFARAMHAISRRGARPFVAVNCAAIPETLIESELFGYRPGAFTGARREGLRGRIAHSSGGTLFLDEIGDMPLALQSRLLRVLEEHQIVPLGSDSPCPVDLHVLAASHRDLREMIAQGSFREDLYYRLNGLTLELPALCERADKERVIRLTLAAQVRRAGAVRIEPEALERLLAYPWPGNVRELRNVVRTALAICDGGIIRLADLPGQIGAPEGMSAGPPASPPAYRKDLLRALERTTLLRVIDVNRGNVSRAAADLGVSRNTLYRKMKRHGIALQTCRAAGLR